MTIKIFFQLKCARKIKTIKRKKTTKYIYIYIHVYLELMKKEETKLKLERKLSFDNKKLIANN